MELIEKSVGTSPIESPLAGQKSNPLAKFVPKKVMLKKAAEKLPMIRKMMGGTSRDITTRPVVMEDRIIDSGGDKIRLRVYSPKEQKTGRDCVMFFHGGGWIGGSIPAVDEYCKALADKADCVVISVDYRLAPEHKFPQGLDDCWNAILWANAHAAELGIDAKKISLSGDSAGGNYAAVLCIKAREEKGPYIKAQILLYPAVALNGDMSPDSSGQGAMMMELIMGWYLGGNTALCNDWRVSPILATSHAGLPKLLLAVGDKDGLLKSSKAYAEKLDAAGVPARCLIYKDTYHAFIDNTGYAPQVVDLLEEIKNFLA